MVWCDFCGRYHDATLVATRGYDLDATPPTSLAEVRDGLAHAVRYGAPSGVAHRCADQHLVYALLLLARAEALDDATRKLALEIVGYYQAFPKRHD